MQNQAYLQLKQRLIKSAKKKKKPLLLQFELTARCNLDCKMCYVHTQNNSDLLHRELTTEQWKAIFDVAYENDMLYATLTGGECLLRKDFKELYLYLWNKHVYVTVMTNGTLISDDYIDFFKRYRPDMIQISLYGSNEDGYLSVTGHKGFEKTINAITALQNANIDVRVVTTPNKYMGNDFIDIIKLCNEKGFVLTDTNISLRPTRDDPMKDDYYLTDDEIFELSKQRAELKRHLDPLDFTPEPMGARIEDAGKGLVCNAGNCYALVTWEGIMYPCIAVMDEGASILELGFVEAWNQTIINAANVVLPKECVGCAYDKTCPKCPAYRVNDLKSGHCNPSVCNLTRRLVAAGVKKLK